MARKLAKKQEETTRSLQKIESGGLKISLEEPAFTGN
jgi:hypothetical protein